MIIYIASFSSVPKSELREREIRIENLGPSGRLLSYFFYNKYLETYNYHLEGNYESIRTEEVPGTGKAWFGS